MDFTAFHIRIPSLCKAVLGSSLGLWILGGSSDDEGVEAVGLRVFERRVGPVD